MLAIKPEETTMTVRLPKELSDAFDRACAQMDRTKSQIIRDLIRQFLNNERQPRLKL